MNNPLWALLLWFARLWWAGVKSTLRFWQRLLGWLLGWQASRASGGPAAPRPATPTRDDDGGDIIEMPTVVALAPPAAPAPADPPSAPPAEPATAPAEPDAAPEAEPAGAKPSRPRFISGSFSGLAGQRAFKLYLPGGPPELAPPLVVMLHGCKQDPDDFARGTQMNALAEAHGCAVLYPAQTEAANTYACWNWFQRNDQLRGLGEPAVLAGMVAQVVGAHRLDDRRVYVTGLSAGAAMANILAHTYPELFAAVGVHSGLPYAAAHDLITALAVMKRGRRPNRWPFLHPLPPPHGAHRLPLIVFHGDKDSTVHPLNGEQVVAQALGEDGADPATAVKRSPPVVEQGQWPQGHAYTLTRYDAAPGSPAIEYWQVHGAGHAWSGGDGRGSFTDPAGPPASQEMLRFFLAQPPLTPPRHPTPP